MANYRWGIDLGTSSIGVAVYETDNNGKIISLKHLDSYIFGEPVAPKEMVTLNTARRSARLIRRQVERKAARLKKMSYIAKFLGVTPEVLRATPEDVVALRAKAVREEISIPQLIKVLSHIVKNRGYKGTLSADDKGTVGKKLSQTAQALTGGKTLGELLYERKTQANGQPWRKVEEDGTFIYRQLVEDEFARIWDTQAKFHPELNGSYAVWGDKMFPDFPGKTEISLKDAFHSAMFYQRPIKWELETVGNCEIYSTEKRAAAAQIAYQHYRMAKTLADLRVRNKNTRESVPLTLAQKSQLFEFLDAHTAEYSPETKAVPFATLYKVLGLPEGCTFTLDRTYHARGGLKGNTTLYSFEKAGVLNAWSNLTDTVQELVLEFFANVSNLSDIEDNSDAYIKERVPELTKNLKPTPQACEACCQFILLLKAHGVLGELVLEQGRSSYSIKALKMLTERIMQGEQEADILAEIEAQKTHPQGKFRSTEAILKEQAINDPVVIKALNEFHRVVQYLLYRNWKPKEIIIELSRDMKKSLSRRQFLEAQNKAQADERNAAKKELVEEFGVLPTPNNIERYLLWKEQAGMSPYSDNGSTKISDAEAFDSRETQVDHIIPQQGEIGGPNTFGNKVLVFTKENHKKSNQLPYQYDNGKFKEEIDAYKAWLVDNNLLGKKRSNRKKVEPFYPASNLIKFVERLRILKEKEWKWSQRDNEFWLTPKGRNIEDKINNLLKTPEELKQDFVDRQNQETAWIGKVVLGWCKDICFAQPTFGTLTAYLRRQLQFDRIIPQIRFSEGKPLYDTDKKMLDSNKLKEILENVPYDKLSAIKPEFEKYCADFFKPCDTTKDYAKALARFQTEIYGSLDKRCDHRHHAVDAAVIGLCSVSIVQKAQNFYKKHNTLYIKAYDERGNRDKKHDVEGFLLENDTIPNLARIRKEVQARLTNYVVWHKPDHFPSGALFDQTAYHVEKDKQGKERFISRAQLSDFLKSNNKLLSPQKLVEHLKEVLWRKEIRDSIIEQLQKRLDSGMSTEEALCGRKLPNSKGQYDPADGIFYRGNKVKKVRYMYQSSFKEGIDKKIHYDTVKEERHKAYKNAGYACMDFEKETGKRIAIIPYWKYKKENTVPDTVIRIFANDILFNKKNKQFYKVQSFKERDGLILWPVTETIKKEKKSANIKEFCLVRTRQDIKRLRDTYCNEHTTSD